mmetsp:Transcript_41128/g.162456  ORF Transcript_41128/g.162456 Transcript_41128/m.162456 type:complete len:110 (-) Transcript_41128:115-444(-)
MLIVEGIDIVQALQTEETDPSAGHGRTRVALDKTWQCPVVAAEYERIAFNIPSRVVDKDCVRSSFEALVPMALLQQRSLNIEGLFDPDFSFLVFFWISPQRSQRENISP